MVVKMMKWRPWPPILSKKFQARLVVKKLDGCQHLLPQEVSQTPSELPRMMMEIRWKGQKIALSSLRRTVKRNFTREEILQSTGSVEWHEEFYNICTLSAYKENAFHPWEITLTLLTGINLTGKNKVSVIGNASLNLSEFASPSEGKEHKLEVPVVLIDSASEHLPCLHLIVSLFEVGTALDSQEKAEKTIVSVPSPPQYEETKSNEKDELSALKAGLRKVKILTEYMSTLRSKKACLEEEGSEGRSSGTNEYPDYTFPFELESLSSFGDELESNKNDSSFRKSFSYDTLASANQFQGYYEISINGEDDDCFYHSTRIPDLNCGSLDEASSLSDQSTSHGSKRSILSWRKRKLSFRSPRSKGEPLLKKTYGEEGGDDIDFDRRQLAPSDYSLVMTIPKVGENVTSDQSELKFGDDNFVIGSWEHREITSRDGHLKLTTNVFFASIDQRSEQAAGESACTALVAVIADWLQMNRDMLPIRSQFDSLIRDGSREWRNLCANEAYQERFPDKHFDLDTVMQAKIVNLCVVPEKSFIGFFHPEEEFDGGFDFLLGAMSFDNIWDEIMAAGPSCDGDVIPRIYIVSWNDHFFILKVETDACYIVDTLGERLFEGCNQAFMLRFDENCAIHKLQSEGNEIDGNVKENGDSAGEEAGNKEEIICKGKYACKEYIKSFLAALPIRELQVDMKKGLTALAPLHHRLQIEFHLTQPEQSVLAGQ